MGIPLQEVLEVSTYYGAVGAYDRSRRPPRLHDGELPSVRLPPPCRRTRSSRSRHPPLLNYMAGWYTHLGGDADKAPRILQEEPPRCLPVYCFPFKERGELSLEDVTRLNPEDSKAWYYLGNLLYYYDQKDAAIAAWTRVRRSFFRLRNGLPQSRIRSRQVSERQGSQPTTTGRPSRSTTPIPSSSPSLTSSRRPSGCLPGQARETRQEQDHDLQVRRPTSRLVYLYVDNGDYDKALDILNVRHFRVWEGGQTVYTQFVDAHLLKGLKLLARHQNKKARQFCSWHLPEGTLRPTSSHRSHRGQGGLPPGSRVQGSRRRGQGGRGVQQCISTAGGGRRRVSMADESKYYVAMSQKLSRRRGCQQGDLRRSRSTSTSSSPRAAPTVVDIYPKFGEDGSNNVINARDLYVGTREAGPG